MHEVQYVTKFYVLQKETYAWLWINNLVSTYESYFFLLKRSFKNSVRSVWAAKEGPLSPLQRKCCEKRVILSIVSGHFKMKKRTIQGQQQKYTLPHLLLPNLPFFTSPLASLKGRSHEMNFFIVNVVNFAVVVNHYFKYLLSVWELFVFVKDS